MGQYRSADANIPQKTISSAKHSTYMQRLPKKVPQAKTTGLDSCGIAAREEEAVSNTALLLGRNSFRDEMIAESCNKKGEKRHMVLRLLGPLHDRPE